jgi:predicted phage tail protein
MRPHRSLFAALITGLAASLLLAPAPGQAFSLGGLFGSRVDKELVAQVPRDKRTAIDKADFEFSVANEEVALAKLKEELAERQEDYASLATKLAKAQAAAAELALDTARINTVEAANLGKREDNLKLMAELREDSVKNESDRIQLKAKLDQTDVFVRDLKNRVADKEQTVAAFKARRPGAPPSTAVAPATAPATAPAPAAAAPAPAPAPAGAQPEEIIRQGLPAPPPAPAPAPEADLKN